MFDPLKDVRKIWSKTRDERDEQERMREKEATVSQVSRMQSLYGESAIDLLHNREKTNNSEIVIIKNGEPINIYKIFSSYSKALKYKKEWMTKLEKILKDRKYELYVKNVNDKWVVDLRDQEN